MHEAVFALCHHLVQTGPSMRSQKAEHPTPTRDMMQVFDANVGRARRSDAKLSYNKSNADNIDHPLSGRIASASITKDNIANIRSNFKKLKKQYPWIKHQSVWASKKRKKCQYKQCPGRKRIHLQEPNRPHDTSYKCVGCSIDAGKDMYFCNDIKKGETDSCFCHHNYHKNKFRRCQPCDDDANTAASMQQEPESDHENTTS